MMQVLTGSRIFDGEGFLDNHAVFIRNGTIETIAADREIPADAETVHLNGGLLVPGFIDVQVNGGGGVLLNDRPAAEGLKTIFESHRPYGTTAMLPTLISDDLETMKATAEAVRQARRGGMPGIIGVHFEGPYLNVERKGVHDPKKIRPFEEPARDIYCAPGLGAVVVTLAPELCPPGLVRSLTEAGIRVCAGHTAGTYDDVKAAIDDGLAGFTHLFNAMTPLDSRAPGVVGAALEDAGTWCGVIADGHHVHPATLKTAMVAKAKGKMMLVTDAMPTVGAKRKSFTIRGEVVRADGGICKLSDGTLAGSDLDMATAVRNTVRIADQPLEEALRMASANPAAFLGLSDRLGRIAPGYQADMVLLDEDLVVKRTWVAGQMEIH